MTNVCRRSFVAIGALVLLAGAVQPAAAQAGPPGGESDIVRAQTLYDRASDLYAEKQYAEALIYFEQASKLVQEPDIHYNIAKCHEKMARYKKAVEHFEIYLRMHREKHGTDAPDKADVDATVRDLARRAAPKEVKLTVATEPPGANVYLGGMDRLVGQTPFETELMPGSYALIVAMEGYEEERQQIVLERGVPRSFSFKLIRKANVGSLLIRVNVAGARIFVEGQLRGLSPYLDEILVPAGRRQVTIEKDGYTSVSRMVVVVAGKPLKIEEMIFLESPPYSWRGYVGWVAFGLGALGVIGGGVIKGVFDQHDLFEDEPLFQELLLYQQVAYGVGGGLMGIGLGLVIWEYTRDAVGSDDTVAEEALYRQPDLPLFPVGVGVTPGGGFAVTGQFRF